MDLLTYGSHFALHVYAKGYCLFSRAKSFKGASLVQLGTSGFAEFSKFGKRVTGFTEFTESDQGISIDFTPKSSIKKKSRNISFDSQKFF